MTWHSPVELELRLDGLPHDDVLCLEFSPDLASLTVGDMLLGAVHSEEVRPFTEVELRDNPDLPDLFDQFADIFERWAEGVATLRFHRPGGEEIDPGAPVRDDPLIIGALGGSGTRVVARLAKAGGVL